MKDYLTRKERINKIYLISGIVLLIISYPIYSAVFNLGRDVIVKIKSDHSVYQNVVASTVLEGDLKNKLLQRNEMLLNCNKFTMKIGALFVAVFPFLGGIFSLLLWRVNSKMIFALKSQLPEIWGHVPN